ncbi:Sensory histidine kinase in two-component regulatory system with RstA [hydrothermal vent metagenome]|uniref:histidine kinase n=1 Tax=hydrothermal vent metagenome TaxID=652676 RepID=A0A3B1ARL4_9ZZZZ
MGHLFLKLYSVFALAVAIYFFVIFNLNGILQGTLERYLGSTTQGTYALLERRLKTMPEEQWQNLINALNQGDGYTIRLQPVASLTFSPSMMDRLNRGAVVFTRINGAIHCYKRVPESEWVLEFPFEQTQDDDNRRLSNSTFNLIDMSLREQPQDNWPTVIASLSQHFKFPVVLLHKTQIGLSASQLAMLESGNIFVQTFDGDDAEFIYRRIAGSPYVTKLGPFDEPLTLSYLQSILIAFLAALVALAVLFWVFPLWRDLKRLNVSTNAFGQGDFSIRASLSKHSVLHHLAETFNGMADRIQRLISSHKELTNAVSHELRTPLARLRFGMEMLQSSSDETDKKRYMASMNADIDELDQLVSELLTYARFDRDKPELKFQRQNIELWLTEVTRQIRIGESNLSIDFKITGNNLKYARFEPRLMARAVGNLLQNAKRYARTRVCIVFTQDNENYQVIIDDDGPGIPENARTHIFEAFKRLDASRDRDTGGYGLGLAIVQRICQWHDGAVTAEDSPLEGARFIIRWPKADIS